MSNGVSYDVSPQTYFQSHENRSIDCGILGEGFIGQVHLLCVDGVLSEVSNTCLAPCTTSTETNAQIGGTTRTWGVLVGGELSVVFGFQ